MIRREDIGECKLIAGLPNCDKASIDRSLHHFEKLQSQISSLYQHNELSDLLGKIENLDSNSSSRFFEHAEMLRINSQSSTYSLEILRVAYDLIDMQNPDMKHVNKHN